MRPEMAADTGEKSEREKFLIKGIDTTEINNKYLFDSCNCNGRTGRGCKWSSRKSEQTFYPFGDEHKPRRRCQSESLYQEGDPLKELNWCCDRGCVLNNHSQKCSQIKKTDLEMNEKKINCTDDSSMDEDNGFYCRNKKQHSKLHEDQVDNELGNQLHNYNHDIELESGKYSKAFKYSSSMEKYNKQWYQPNMYQATGDFSHQNVKSLLGEKTNTNVKERYMAEMEILKSKLNLLRSEMGGDGKRLRQRSESEPGFAEVSGGVPKRARDLSPKTKSSCRRVPAHLTANQGLLARGSFSDTYHTVTPFSVKEVNESDEDQELDDHIRDDVSDDDGSVQSSLTSASSDSTTPSRVGETLGSITLNETKPEVQTGEEGEKPVPAATAECQESSTSTNGELFRSSLFPNVPPYVKFFMHDFKGPALPVEITKHLKWKLSNITPIVIRRTLLNSGFKLVRRSYEQYYRLCYVPPHRKEGVTPPFPSSKRKPKKESNEWTGQWGKHMKSFVFKTLKDFQKLNHFPGSFQIGRKDRLWKNLNRLMVKFGKKEFGFIPKTYILPHDRKLLRTAWEKFTGPGKGQWIVKPPAAARGTGIKVVHKWGQIPKKKSLIVQKYIAQPYLINGSKFDLRLYVLMTSIHPLRIYLYEDGLVRFASVKYSDNVECLSNRFMHLTNYSINKFSNQYQVNADATSCNGHKWSLKSLWTYLTKEGVNVKTLKRNLIDLVIKTIISGESNIHILSKNNLPSRYCSYELFGMDVLFDHSLKPWLLEVNISPSLHSASPLDLAVKGPLVKELLNIAGFQIPAKLTKEQENEYLGNFGMREKTHTLCYDKRLYWTTLSKEEKTKQEFFQNVPRSEYLDSILEELTPDDIRHLIQFEDELTQIKRFEKIFPTTQTYVYHQFFESPRYYNMMLDAWETKYQRNRREGIVLLSSLCEQKLHLNVPFPGGRAKSSPSQNDLNSQHPDGETDSEMEKEETKPEEEKKEEEEPETTALPESRSSPSKPKSPTKPTVVSKPMFLTNRTVGGRRGGGGSGSPTKPRVALNETCMKMLAEIRQNGLKFQQPESQTEKLKQLPNCKLENSMSEGLSTGKNVLSPSKHIHNACIKMNSSS